MKPIRIRTIRKPIILAAGLIAASLAHAQSYQFIDLGTGTANGINDLGEVVGQSYLGATLWNNGREIGLTGGYGGSANAINNLGQIVGDTYSSNATYAALWSSTGALSSLNAPKGSSAVAINNVGQIVGNVITYGQSNGALFWNHSASPTVLGVSGGTTNGAWGINDSGTIVGTAYLTNGTTTVPVVWQGSTTTILPNLINYDAQSGATAINNAGVIVGSSTYEPQSNSTLPLVWKGGSFTQLGTLGSAPNDPLAINNAGQIVGEATTPNGYQNAAIWQGGTIVNLNSYLTPAEVAQGWDLLTATAINNKGWIVGEAYNNNTNTYDAYELKVASPVPEPQTWAMLLAGAGLIGAAVRRRKPGRHDDGLEKARFA